MENGCLSNVIELAQFDRAEGFGLRSRRGQEPHNDDMHGEKETLDARRAEPDEHRVRRRAYQMLAEEGRPDGRALDNWLRAKWGLGRAHNPKHEVKRLEGYSGPGEETG